MTAPTSTADRRSAAAPQGGELHTALVVLAVLSEAWPFVTAGQLSPGAGALGAHQAGAPVLHVTSGLTAVAALASRRGAAPTWLWVLAGAVLGLTVVQAATGDRTTPWVHVPGAMVVTVGSVCVLATAVGLRAPRRAAVRP